MLSACDTVPVCKPGCALQRGIQSYGVSSVIQCFLFFEETSRDWPRRATSFFASLKKMAKKGWSTAPARQSRCLSRVEQGMRTACCPPAQRYALASVYSFSRQSDMPSGKRNKLACGSDKFRFFIRLACHFVGSAKAEFNNHSLYALPLTLSLLLHPADAGNTSLASNPPSGRFANCNVPLCCCAILRAMVNPRPVPPVSRERDCSRR